MLTLSRPRHAGLSLAKHLLDFRCGQRSTEKKTLHLIATFRAQQRQFLTCLNSFGSRRDSKALSETCYGADDSHRVAARSKVMHKGAINLDFVEREASQVA